MKHPASKLTCAVAAVATALCVAQQPVQTTTTRTEGFTHNEMSSRRAVFDVSLLNGVPLHGDARGVPGLDYQAVVAVTMERDNVALLHRLVIDRTHHLYFGYTLFADRVAGEEAIHLHFGALRGLSMFQGVDLAGFQPASTAPAVPDRITRVGEPVIIPLEQDAGGKIVLEDRLNFGPPA